MFGMILACTKHNGIHSNMVFLITYSIPTGAWCVLSCIFCFTTIDYFSTRTDDDEVDDALFPFLSVISSATLLRIYCNHIIYKFIRIKTAKVRHIYDLKHLTQRRRFAKNNAPVPI
eukprot:374717_1